MSKLKPAVNNGDHSLGNQHASVVLVEFGDFECPHCGRAHPLLQRLIKNYGNDLHFVFRNFPLQESHPHAYMAAVAAESAGQQGKFWEMHDLIFEHQSRLSKELILDLAERLHLDINKFAADWASDATVGKVEMDFESGVRSGVNGTPGFFINGSPLVTYDETYESLSEAVELAMEMKSN